MLAGIGGGPLERLRDALVEAVPVIVREAGEEIRNRSSDIGSGGDLLERNLHRGLADAVYRWFDGGPSEELDLHFALGRAQARAGRSLDELLTVYRVAGQTMWRQLTAAGTAQGIPPAELYRLAETGFGCLDEVSTQAAEGFAEEHSHRSGVSRSRRGELVRLVLEQPQPARETLERAAAEGGIELTGTIACFVGAAERQDALARAAGELALVAARGETFTGLLPDPDGPGRRQWLAGAAARAGVLLALGPCVPLAEARLSLARAKALYGLCRDGTVADLRGPLVRAEEHDVELLLSAEPRLAEEICQRVLGPLTEVRGRAARTNLEATLAAWLRRPGQRKAIAHELGVHPQTVRYRLGRLRDLFGEALEDPDRRFELALALRLRRCGDPGPGAGEAAGRTPGRAATAQSSGVVQAPVRPQSTRKVEAATAQSSGVV
jgi:hypothetical protein